VSLRKSGRRLDDHYDVIAGTSVVGRIMLFTSTPTKEAALDVFARNWFANE
jgi:hypothetical protein